MNSFTLYRHKSDKVSPRFLISEEFVKFSKAISHDNSLNIWFCNKSGKQQVMGGIYGEQKIKSTRINDNTSEHIMDSLEYINYLTGLAIQKVHKKNKADIRIYLDKKIDLGAGAQYVGLTVLNEEESNWEIFISQKKINNENHKIYAILHEIGHTLGLEHPHDDQDNDFYSNTTVKYSATPNQTIMSYREPIYNEIFPNKYTANDLKALETIWGSSPKSASLSLDQLTRKPIRPKILGRRKLQLPTKPDSDIIINGKGAPNAHLNVFFQNKFHQTIASDSLGEWSIIFERDYLKKQSISLGSYLKIEQLDEFGNIVQAKPYYVDLI